MKQFHEIALLSFTALITMVNPLAVIPSFVAMTASLTRSARARVALLAGLATMVVLAIFLAAGNLVFQFFGITIPAFQIMGGLVFSANALRTLTENTDRRIQLGGDKRLEDHALAEAEAHAEVDPSSIAVVPLAIPLLSGPGAITSTMLLVNLYPRWEQKIAVLAAILGVGVASWLVLLTALPLSRFIGDRGRAVFTKIMALLLGAIGIQFIINGLKPIVIDLLRAS
jgi:multiple antibiotic resistance protein